MALQLLFVYVPFLNLWFHSAPIPLRDWLLPIGMALSSFSPSKPRSHCCGDWNPKLAKDVGSRFGDKVASGRQSGANAKHRTEVTEVTEGDGGGGRISIVNTLAPVRERGKGWSLGENNTQWAKHRTEVTEGDWGRWGTQNLHSEHLGVSARTRQKGGVWARITRNRQSIAQQRINFRMTNADPETNHRS